MKNRTHGLARMFLWLGNVSSVVCVIAMVVFCAGCSESVARLDKKDRQNVYVERARGKTEQGDVKAAMELYRQALDIDPTLALAHLDLALLLHESGEDYVGTIYHYRRYIELRPDAEKRKMIENRMRLASQSFAAEVAGRLHAGNSAAVAGLEEKNKKLSETIEHLEKKNAILKEKLLQKQEMTSQGQ